MPAILWDEALTTGIESIDKQHKEMFRQANLLFEALGRKPDDLRIKVSLQFFVEYAEKHFKEEQRAMRTFSYPKRMAHAFEHDKIKKELHELVREFINGGNMLLPSRLGQLMSSWMTQHIKKSDAEFIQFMKQKNQLIQFSKD